MKTAGMVDKSQFNQVVVHIDDNKIDLMVMVIKRPWIWPWKLSFRSLWPSNKVMMDKNILTLNNSLEKCLQNNLEGR